MQASIYIISNPNRCPLWPQYKIFGFQWLSFRLLLAQLESPSFQDILSWLTTTRYLHMPYWILIRLWHSCLRTLPTSSRLCAMYMSQYLQWVLIRIILMSDRRWSHTLYALQAYTWDWLLSMPEEYALFLKVGFSPPNIVYFLSRSVIYILWDFLQLLNSPIRAIRFGTLGCCISVVIFRSNCQSLYLFSLSIDFNMW